MNGAKFKLKHWVIYNNVVYRILSITEIYNVFTYNLIRVYPDDDIVNNVAESDLKLWNGRVNLN